MTHKTTIRFALAAGILTLAGGAGCSSDLTRSPVDSSTDPVSDLAADDAFHLLAEVPVGDRSTLAFYEPEPGIIIVSGTGPVEHVDDTLPSTAARLPSDMFRRVSSEPVPQALLDAEDELRHAAEHSPPVDGGHDGLSPDRADPTDPRDSAATESASWFANTFCSITAGYDFDVCLLNRTGHAWWKCWGVDDYFVATYAAQGNILLKLATTIGYGGTWSVPQGHYRWHRVWGSNFTARSDILEASGDLYHYTVGCEF